jgi:hypothetical protein
VYAIRKSTAQIVGFVQLVEPVLGRVKIEALAVR